jgi:hypothetical protein
MNSTAALYRELFEITRGDLDNACFPYVSPAEMLQGLAPLRPARMSDFWRDGESKSLFRATEEFVSGLFGQGCEGAFLLRGLPNEVQSWVATETQSADRPSLESLLRSSYSRVRLGSDIFDPRSTEALRYSLAVTGTPSLQSQLDAVEYNLDREHYIRPEVDQSTYERQFVEADAERFGTNTANEILERRDELRGIGIETHLTNDSDAIAARRLGLKSGAAQ